MRFQWRPYRNQAQRRRDAAAAAAKLARKGHRVSPVEIVGRAIARTFWGSSWCSNLERYSDFANRLPRGRTYVRNGSVFDLQIGPGRVEARVSGSAIYTVEVEIAPLAAARWRAICIELVGSVGSLVELLQGRFSQAVMERICRPGTGLFPAPGEIRLDCSCPDWAEMCKHVAAVLYGIGARLDHEPNMLFHLRQVDPGELIARAASSAPLSATAPASERVLAEEGLEEMFGIELAEGPVAAEPVNRIGKAKRAGSAKRAAGGAKAGPAAKARAGKRAKAPAGKPRAGKVTAARRKRTTR